MSNFSLKCLVFSSFVLNTNFTFQQTASKHKTYFNWLKVCGRGLYLQTQQQYRSGSMYTEREMTFPSPFTFVHSKVTPPSHQCRYLSFLFSLCIVAVTSSTSYLASSLTISQYSLFDYSYYTQSDVTSKCLSRARLCKKQASQFSSFLLNHAAPPSHHTFASLFLG